MGSHTKNSNIITLWIAIILVGLGFFDTGYYNCNTNNIPLVFWLTTIASIVALGMAWYFFRSMMKEEEGTDRMKEIAEHVRKGAMAYLKQQYKVVTIVFIVLAIVFAFMAYVLKVQNPWVPFAFLTGGLFSGLAGFFGMKTATYASARTANGARTSLDKGMKIAFRSGAVMGLVIVGLGLLDIAIWFIPNRSLENDKKFFLMTAIRKAALHILDS